MLDLKLIREDPDSVRAGLERRKVPGAIVDDVLALDARRRELLPEVEGLRGEQKRASEAIAEAKRGGEDASAAIEEMRGVAARVKELAGEVGAAEERLDSVLASLPNLAHETAAPEDETVREWGEAGRSGRDHLELLGWMVDMEAGARLSGSRFAYLRGPLVMLELALVRWALDLLASKGFEPVIPPVLVREEALFGTGFLPDTEEQIYRVPDDDLYLAGTSEVALASLHAGQIFDPGTLPRRYAGFSPCFRREAGAAGKDTRGIFRVHQFDKVEMFAFVEPEDSWEEHERLLAIEEEIYQALEIPYRVVNIAAWDLGASAAKKYDIEGWFPGQERYRELTSCSNTTDYQARRLDARYRPAEGAPPRHVHTLNGTAIGVQRTIIALAENHQQGDGTVRVPEALHGFGAPKAIGPVA
ncbi:MAG: seryl-tRNA synthetase [Thermoleophilaceae bacterium]|nr:seryl-tRNA synthetase [Thermoleophilaceae bacterium]